MTAADLVAFVAELVLLATTAVVGFRLDTPVPAVLLGVVLPAAVGIVWAVWLAPRASRRLPPAARGVLKLALVLGVGALLLLDGVDVAVTVAFAVLLGGSLVAADLRRRPG